jgi:serine/threonine protein kinase
MLQLEIMKKLDQGTFSKVYLARDMNNNKILALKKIDEKILSDKGKNYLLNEIKILRMFNHPNIIKLYFVLKKPNFTYLGIEYCNGGSLSDNLYDYIKQHKKPFPEKLVQKIMKQILTGVKCLHDKGIIHRDLKLKNILIYYDNDSDLKNHNLYGATIKIIDFNTSYILNSFMPYSVVGTPLNMAPSIAQNMFNAPKPYDDKIDIWSLGTLCYEMLFGKPLLPGSKKEEVYQNILNKNFYIPKTISVQARMFLLNMLRKDGINRLCASELLNHEFITLNYHNFKMYNLIKDNTKINNNIPYFNKINNNYNNNNNNYRNNNLIFKRDDNNKINILPQNNIYPFNQEKCNGCGEQSFHFIFYKCMECADVIYCQKCYNQFRNEHTHKFQKIKKIIIKNQIIDIPRGARSPKINKNKKLLMRNGSDNNFPYMNTNPQNNHQCQTFQNYNNNASYI